MNPAVKAAKVDRIRRTLEGAQLDAAKHVRAVVRGEHPDSDVPWKEVTGRTRACLILAQGSMAADRAKTMSEAPRQLGVVVVHPRLEDTPANRLSWEAQAAALRDQRAIEAVPVKAKEET